MGWRWRRIFNVGPFRTTISPGGAGFSWGIPGLRFGVSPNGRKYMTVGFPGLGLYYTWYFKMENNSAPTSVHNPQSTSQIQTNPPVIQGNKSLKWWTQPFFKKKPKQ